MRHNISPTAEPGTATRPMDTDTIYGRPGMGTAVATPEEWALVAHARGHCHDRTRCALCTADTEVANARVMAERQHARARTQELRAVDAEIQNAYLTREVMRLTNTVDSIISG